MARGKVGTLVVDLRANTAQFVKAMEQSGRKVRRLGSRLKGMGQSMTMGLTLPLVGAAAASLKLSTDLNKAMADVATLIPDNAERINELKGNVQSLAIETGKSTSDLAQGLYQVVSAFGDSAEASAQLETSVRAAVAGVATTTEAINLLSAVTKGYGDTSAAAMQKASDLSFLTVKMWQTTFPELAESIGRVVPLAASLKVRQEELFAGFATLTGVTGQATEVSTQFAAIIRAMIKPTEGMKAALGALGAESAMALVQERGLVGALQDLIGTTDGSQEAIAGLFGRAEALTAVFALADSQADTFAQKLAAMESAAGATDAAFDEQTTGINAAGFAWSQFQQKLAVTAQTLGDQLGPVLIKVLDAATPLLDMIMGLVKKFSEWDPTIQTVVLAVAGLVAALGPVATIIGTVITAVATIGPALGAIGTVATGPIGIAIAAAVGLYMAIKHWDEISAFAKKVYEGVKEWIQDKLGAVLDWVGEKVEAVKGFFKNLYEDVVGHSYVPDMVRGVESWMGRLGDALDSVKDNAIQGLSDAIADLAMTGAANFTALVNSLIRDLIRLAAKMYLVEPLFGALTPVQVVASPAGEDSSYVSMASAPSPGGGSLGNFTINVNNQSPIPLAATAQMSGGALNIDLAPAIEEWANSGRGERVFGRTWGARRVPVQRS